METTYSLSTRFAAIAESLGVRSFIIARFASHIHSGYHKRGEELSNIRMVAIADYPSSLRTGQIIGHDDEVQAIRTAWAEAAA